jgi:RNA polymerase sigma-70 factor (ECF subfamily)
MAGIRSIGGGDDPDVAAVAAVVAGETSRFGEIYLRHYARVHSYARALMRDAAEAEDVAQETFLLALRALPRYEDRGLPFRAWLLRIAHNAALKRLGARRPEPLDPDALARALERGSARDVDALSDGELVALTAELPLAQRQVLLLRLVLGFSSAETGEILGRTPEGVRQLQTRALQTLRKRLTSADAPTVATPSRMLALAD